MRRVRIIPVLLLHKRALVKSLRFRNYKYVGDPINAVKIFNEKEVDEIVILDISATTESRGPNFEQLAEIAGEAFFPLAYGGGITNIDQIKQLFYLGVEKVVINTSAYTNPGLITQAANLVGSQSVVASVDIQKRWNGAYAAFHSNGTKGVKVDPISYIKNLERAGVGEILLNSIERDGTFKGMDYNLIAKVSKEVNVPVVACGGANSLEDFRKAITSGASAVAAGSYFVFQRPHNAVLITYPSQEELIKEIYTKV